VQVLLLSVTVFLLEFLCGGTFHSSPGTAGLLWPAGLWLGWIGWLFVYVNSAKDPGPIRGSYATAGLGAGLIGFLAHSLVDFDHYVGGLFHCAAILMGVLLAARLAEERPAYVLDRPLRPAARAGMVVAALVAACALAYGFVLPAAESSVHRGRALDRQADQTAAQRLAELEAAIRANPWDAHLHALLSDLLIGLWWGGVRRDAGGVSTLSEAIVQAREASVRHPARSEYYTRLGRLYELRWARDGLAADYRSALRAYLRAAEWFPSLPDTALNLGRLYDRGRKYDLAAGKYFTARRNSAEQYHIPRKFSRAELRELNERIDVLRGAITRGESPPPLHFTQPRLLGWPGYGAVLGE
jgi:hypothetical protein